MRREGRERTTGRALHACVRVCVSEVTSCLCPVALQTVVTLESGKLVQKQSWDGKETIIEREVLDGKLIAVRILVSSHLFFFFWEMNKVILGKLGKLPF